MIPPNKPEVERLVLFACLVDPNGYARIQGKLSPRMFFKRQNRLVFEAMVTLFISGSPIDILTVSEKLTQTKQIESAGGDVYLAGLSTEATTAVHLESHAEIIRDAFIRREILKIGYGIPVDIEKDESPEVLISELITKLSQAHAVMSDDNHLILLKDSVNKVIFDITKQLDNPKSVEKVLTGIPSLDVLLGGLVPGVSIIAARPSVGKTQIMLNFAMNISKKFPTLIFSAEMTSQQLAYRALATETQINSRDLRCANIDDDKYKVIIENAEMQNRMLYFDDTSKPTALHIRARTVTMMAQHDIKIIFIDHLGKMGFHTKHNRINDNWREIGDELCNIARDLKIPVVLLMQLSREIERRGKDQRPVLSDLREVGEEFADVVMMLWREHYQDSGKPDDPITKDDLEIIVRKSRDGALATILAYDDLATGKIGELERDKPPF